MVSLLRNPVKRQELPCYERGNGSPFCSPVSTDVWNNGSHHQFVWNYQYPFYVSYDEISLYLYYKDKFAYQKLKNWTDLPRSAGSLDVQVDDTWFPHKLTSGPAERTWTLYGFYLPAGLDPTAELVNPASQFPRPFNFSAVQFASPNNQDGRAEVHHGLSPWAIALIVLGSVATLTICAASLIWLISVRRRKQHGKLCPSSSTAVREQPYGEKMEQPSIHSSTPIMHEDRASTISRLPAYTDWTEEEPRRKLGEEILKRQLEEEGTLLKNAQQRQTRIHITSSTAELQRSP